MVTSNEQVVAPAAATVEIPPAPPTIRSGVITASRDGGCSVLPDDLREAASHPTAIPAASTTAATAIQGNTPVARAIERRCVDAVEGIACSAPLRIAAANSAALANRSAGSFCSAVSTAALRCGGTDFRTSSGGTGSAVITFATIACAVGPVNGGSPTSISYVTAPSAYTSDRAVICRSPIACSGLM